LDQASAIEFELVAPRKERRAVLGRRGPVDRALEDASSPARRGGFFSADCKESPMRNELERLRESLEEGRQSRKNTLEKRQASEMRRLELLEKVSASIVGALAPLAAEVRRTGADEVHIRVVDPGQAAATGARACRAHRRLDPRLTRLSPASREESLRQPG
jgi:hypothetical protein